jgi:hypothetical protein
MKTLIEKYTGTRTEGKAARNETTAKEKNWISYYNPCLWKPYTIGSVTQPFFMDVLFGM